MFSNSNYRLGVFLQKHGHCRRSVAHRKERLTLKVGMKEKANQVPKTNEKQSCPEFPNITQLGFPNSFTVTLLNHKTRSYRSPCPVIFPPAHKAPDHLARPPAFHCYNHQWFKSIWTCTNYLQKNKGYPHPDKTCSRSLRHQQLQTAITCLLSF